VLNLGGLDTVDDCQQTGSECLCLAGESIVSVKKLGIHIIRNVLDETTSGIFAQFLNDLACASRAHASDIIRLIFLFARCHLDTRAVSWNDHGAAAFTTSESGSGGV
jgi:hypothetical protein